MVGWSDEGWGTKKGGSGGPGVTEYASVSELVTASEGSLAPVYYEVVGEWITYWDGSAFSPPYPNATTSSVLMEPAVGLYVGAGFFAGMTAQNRVFDADEIGAVTFCANHTIRADQISIGVAGGAGAGKSVRVLFFDSHPVTNRPTNLLYQSPDIDCSASGERTVDVDPIWTFVAGKTYWVAVWSSDTLTLRGMNQNQAPWLSADFSGSSVVSYVSLVRSQTWADGTAADWSYASAQHSTDLAALVGLRVAA